MGSSEMDSGRSEITSGELLAGVYRHLEVGAAIISGGGQDGLGALVGSDFWSSAL